MQALTQANLTGISQYKKLQFEISGVDYSALKAKFNVHFDEFTHVAKHCLREYNGKYYADVTLNSWQQSDASLMKFQEKIGQEKPLNVSIKVEFYDFIDNDALPVKGMRLRFIKMN